MEHFVLLVIAVLFGSYVLGFGLIKRVNEWYHVRYLGNRKKSLPPGDMGWPFIGNLLPLLKAFQSENPATFFFDAAKRYGKTGIFKTSIFWSPTVMVYAPETCRAVLMDDEKFGRDYLEPSATLIGHTAWERIANIEHKRLRKLMISPIIGHEALSVFILSIEKVVNATLQEWTSTEKPIEFLDETRKVAFKIITRLLLGSSCESVDIGSLQKYSYGLSNGLLMPVANINFPGFPYYNALKAKDVLRKILQGVIDEVRRRKTPRSNEEKGMVDLFMELKYEDGRNFEDEEIIDLLVFFMVAGQEGTAHALMWSTLFLHQQPEFLRKAKEEQLEIIKRRPASQKGLTYGEIKQMGYLSKIIDEALRRSSVTFLILRRAKADATINGYLIPRGWRVIVSNIAVHMDPDTHFSPEEFIPSRWTNQAPKLGSLIPFGAGSHLCPGADFAKLEIYIFLHYFIRNYKFEQVNPKSPWIYSPGPRPEDNCLARIAKIIS